MTGYDVATPFGRRSVTLAQIAAQVGARARAGDAVAHKWQVFRDLCVAKDRLCVSERALAVLNALLTFHPETVLSGEGLVVFPSNVQLAHRAHGMAAATLRRHLSVLVEAGIVVRRDSPNGKRYARKGRDGAIDGPFGFDLAPLVARAGEFSALADEVREEEWALKRVKERVTLLRRDISKMIAAGIEAGIETGVAVGRGQGREGGRESGPGDAPGLADRPDLDCPGLFADWAEAHALYRAIVARIPRTATRRVLEAVAGDLETLAGEIRLVLEAKALEAKALEAQTLGAENREAGDRKAKTLGDHAESENPSRNESQTERHKQNSKSEPTSDLEPRLQEGRGDGQSFVVETPRPPDPDRPDEGGNEALAGPMRPSRAAKAVALEPTADGAGAGERSGPGARAETGKGAGSSSRPQASVPQAYPLGMVMEACPDLSDYARSGIANWRDFVATAGLVRSMLGISPSAFEAARDAMGEIPAAIVVACLLQKGDRVANAGGYLRALTQKAEAQEFSLGPMLMALIGTRKRERKSA